MAQLDDLAITLLEEHKLPSIFSYRQAFILGYNERKRREYALLYGKELELHPLENRDNTIKETV